MPSVHFQCPYLHLIGPQLYLAIIREEQNDRRMKLGNAAVLLLLLVALLPVQAQTGNINDLNLSRLAEAVEAISRGHLSKAENLLKSVLSASPGDSDALNLLGVVRAQEQK